MTPEQIKKQLGENTVHPDGGLYNLGWYIGWNVGEKEITLDGQFTIENLEAIVAHMRSHPK